MYNTNYWIQIENPKDTLEQVHRVICIKRVSHLSRNGQDEYPEGFLRRKIAILKRSCVIDTYPRIEPTLRIFFISSRTIQSLQSLTRLCVYRIPSIRTGKDQRKYTLRLII